MTCGLRRVGRIAAVLLPFALAACQMLRKPSAEGDGLALLSPMGESHLGKNPTMHALACDLDHLEKHIDWYGSVVAKVPDVWGQARLTKYREEFELLMSQQKDTFKLNLQGSLYRSDQTYFADALAISAAIQPKRPIIGSLTTTKAPVLIPTDAQTVTQSSDTTVQGITKSTQTTENAKAPTPAAAPAPVKPFDLPDVTKLVPDNVIQRNTITKIATLGGDLKTNAIGLEPTIVLDQMSRYLNYLHQIRRNNEGDDTADSPGYSLNLMRIPVSVFPGKRTDVGFGAEITMTITPILGEDLLPVTFRNLVINDLVQHLGLPLTSFLDRQDIQDGVLLTEDNRQALRGLDLLDELAACSCPEMAQTKAAKFTADQQLRVCAAIRIAAPPECWKYPPPVPCIDPKCKDRDQLAACRQLICKFIATELFRKDAGLPCVAAQGSSHSNKQYSMQATRHFSNRLKSQSAETKRFRAKNIQAPGIPFSNGLLAREPFPTSLILDVFGVGNSFEIAYGAHETFQDEILQTGYVHLPNIQTYLREELNAAYQFLNTHPQSVGVLPASAGNGGEGAELRPTDRPACSISRTHPLDMPERSRLRTESTHRTTGILQDRRPGVVHSCGCRALLADRLQEDMKQTASSKETPLPLAGQWLDYYSPDPSPQARQAFNDYVRVRWPVRVFALDPTTQDQNISDALSTKREMQLALSLAFTNGAIGAQNFTRLARRLEAEYETVALNRTQVGFSHGENVFGWRFYPRFQTPDTPSIVTAFVRDTIIGGPNRNQLLRQRRLEPGPRECVAIVLMPSFVPYLHLDTISNWFPLTNPKHKVLDNSKALKLSRSVHAIKTDGCGVVDACNYRDGDYQRLLRRADQLDARLPMQTQIVQVPQLNTLSGFEMFNHGIADLCRSCSVSTARLASRPTRRPPCFSSAITSA